MRLIDGDERRLIRRIMKNFLSRHRVACWLGFALIVAALFGWGVGKNVPAFPADYQGVWRDERGVGVVIGPSEIQWTDAQGNPTKIWKCERLHAYPGGVSFSLKGEEERVCVEWSMWNRRIQFGYHEELETGPNSSVMRWTPQSWQMSKMR